MEKVYILGGAQTDFERNWSKEGKGMIALLREVIEEGMKTTGLKSKEIERLNQNNKIARTITCTSFVYISRCFDFKRKLEYSRRAE